MVSIAIVIGGCTGPVPSSVSPSSPPAPNGPSASKDPISSPSASAVPEPALQPGGTASANLPFFDSVNKKFLANDSTPGGRGIIDNLVAAGFDRATMQVTPDQTAIGRDVDSVQFSVRMGSECLIGQASATGYAATVGPVVSDTSCLLGITRAIDW